jgi:hypothetical protein
MITWARVANRAADEKADEMSERDETIPARAAVIGRTTPTPLARGGISPNARAKLAEINPDATRALREALARSPGHDGMARDRR